ncbi:MAG: gluconate 2-dehydrogenase subunit 3 family protein [Gemmatimonadetes bacterium]|nr:gluconate 2-dehydrogenase subunit 3 family protein [Gemmatimonadota bacterium]
MTRREALRRTAWLLGGAISAPTIAGVLAGCGGDRTGAAGKALTGRQLELVGAIAEHIIPETDTPGAKAVHVDRFVDEMLATYYPEEERALFLAGLAEVDERARQAHGNAFLDCTPEEQLDLLRALDRESFAPVPPRAKPRDPAPPADVDVRARLEGGDSPLPEEVETDTVQWIHGESRRPGRASRPFFRTMKELTVVGYYTSEPGATVELRHEAVPGRYEGCVPLAQIGRAWAV